MRTMFMSNSKGSNATRVSATALVGIFLISQAEPVYAYVDPGSASVVVTAVLGVIAAAGYTARLYIAKFKSLFKRGKKDIETP